MTAEWWMMAVLLGFGINLSVRLLRAERNLHDLTCVVLDMLAGIAAAVHDAKSGRKS